MIAIETALTAGVTVFSGLLGGWVGGQLALRAVRQQAAIAAAATREEKRAERETAELLAQSTDRRKFLFQRIDRKVELLKQSQSLLELCAARRGDPNSIRTAATLLGVSKALAAVVLDPVDQTRLILPFRNLLEPQDDRTPFDLGPAKAGLKHLVELIDADVKQLRRMMDFPADDELSKHAVTSSSNK